MADSLIEQIPPPATASSADETVDAQPSRERPAQGPLPRRVAFAAVARCVATTARLLARRRIHLPTDHVGLTLHFADHTSARVYRETTVTGPANADHQGVGEPCVLVVSFRLRWVRGRLGHGAFRLESLLNTPLFVGFPGFVSKLWLAHDQDGAYRGLYEWDGAARAERYARSLWRVLALVSVPGTIRYEVLPGLQRDEVLRDPGRLPAAAAPTPPANEPAADWWRLVASP